MYSQTITVKLDSTTHNQLSRLAQKDNISKSQIIRQAINHLINSSSPTAGQSLVNMAHEAKNHSYQAPKDIIENLDKYLYEQP